MNYLTLPKIALPTLALLLAGAVTSQAQVIAYENFDYAPGSQLNGLTADGSGGYGWATTWSATSAALATNTYGMTYAGIEASGGGVLMGNPEGSTGSTASSQRMLSDTLGNLATTHSGGASGSIWISMLYQNLRDDQAGALGFREAKLVLFSGATANANGTANVNGSERLDIGSPNTYSLPDELTVWQGANSSPSGIATPRGLDPINTTWLLMRIDLDNTSTADTAYAWFNADATVAPSDAAAITFSANDLSGVNALRLQAGNLNGSATNAIFLADELRVGYDFINVVPEPSVFALAGLGIFALIARRRTNK